jgi:alpha-D-ribose 1-methylphosphonate 5-phosphate C-P lyase
VVRRGEISTATGYPCMVADRYLLSPSPIPRWDVPKLNMAECLYLFGAGREKRVYAIPPYTKVEPIDFEDYPFFVERFDGASCARCGAANVYLNEVVTDDGRRAFTCSDSGYCDSRTAEVTT